MLEDESKNCVFVREGAHLFSFSHRIRLEFVIKVECNIHLKFEPLLCTSADFPLVSLADGSTIAR